MAEFYRFPRHLIDRRHYATIHAVQATRGCPHNCTFCSVTAFNHRIQRRQPVESIVREVAAIPDRFFMFVDDNLTADRDYATELCGALRPLGKSRVCQATLALADDPHFVRRAADAGCIGLFAGLETFNAENLESVHKDFDRVDRYRERIERLHANGIGLEAGIGFGFDSDDRGVFSRTLHVRDELHVDIIQTSILTPLPGTPMFQKMSDRIMDRNWTHYDFRHVVFEPRHMSAEALQAGHDWVVRKFYRPRRIACRLTRVARWPDGLSMMPYVLALNLAYYGRVRRWHFEGWDPARDIKTEPSAEIHET